MGCFWEPSSAKSRRKGALACKNVQRIGLRTRMWWKPGVVAPSLLETATEFEDGLRGHFTLQRPVVQDFGSGGGVRADWTGILL